MVILQKPKEKKQNTGDINNKGTTTNVPTNNNNINALSNNKISPAVIKEEVKDSTKSEESESWKGWKTTIRKLLKTVNLFKQLSNKLSL